MVFNGLIESVLFYGLEVFGHAALKKRNLSKFRRVFASGARAICKGSRSAGFEGVMACAGVIPPEFRIRQILVNRFLSTKWLQKKLDDEVKLGVFSAPHIKAAANAVDELGMNKFVGNVEERFKFLLKDNKAKVVLKGETFESRPCLKIYTDGSKSKNGVGCGLVVYDHTNQIRLFEWKVRLNHESEIFQAELRALREAIQLAWSWGVDVDIFSDSLSVLQNVRSARKGTTQLLDLIQNWPPGARAIWVKAHVGLMGNEDADGVAKEAVEQRWIRREKLQYSIGTVKRYTQRWAMKQWALKWRSYDCTTFNVKKFFPELKHFKEMWRKGFWHWTTPACFWVDCY